MLHCRLLKGLQHLGGAGARIGDVRGCRHLLHHNVNPLFCRPQLPSGGIGRALLRLLLPLLLLRRRLFLLLPLFCCCRMLRCRCCCCSLLLGRGGGRGGGRGQAQVGQVLDSGVNVVPILCQHVCNDLQEGRAGRGQGR